MMSASSLPQQGSTGSTSDSYGSAGSRWLQKSGREDATGDEPEVDVGSLSGRKQHVETHPCLIAD